jgi:hypothetical protein
MLRAARAIFWALGRAAQGKIGRIQGTSLALSAIGAHSESVRRSRPVTSSW